MTELKPCPFCGDSASIVYTKDCKLGGSSGWTSNILYLSYSGFIMCRKCRLRTREYKNVSKAIKAWNTITESEETK